MKRPDLVAALPDLVALAEKHRVRALQQLARPDSPLSPSELLVRLHVIAPTPDHPLLRKVGSIRCFFLLFFVDIFNAMLDLFSVLVLC